ncbi:hypothetical protein Q7P37_007912 [Cladosporium fusiforme]
MTRRANREPAVAFADDGTTTVTKSTEVVGAPSTFNDGLPLPKMIVFDLDYTLWPFWIDTHVTPPLKRSPDGLTVKDRYGESYGFYNDTAGILSSIKQKDIILGAASRTHTPELAREALTMLKIPRSSGSSGPHAFSLFDHLEIFPGDKKTHFAKLQKKSGVEYEEMLFFDDESRNKNVETLGVVMQLVNNGMSKKEVDRGVEAWRRRNGRTEREEANTTTVHKSAPFSTSTNTHSNGHISSPKANMSESPIPPIPSVQSRCPRTAEAEARQDAAKAWLADAARQPRNCPVQEVTNYISFSTAVGKTLLSKYDTSKLIHLYDGMYVPDRIHMVQDLRKDVTHRESRDVEWRKVHIMATQRCDERGEDCEDWKALREVSREAIENTAELKLRLTWCETQFETGSFAGGRIDEYDEAMLSDDEGTAELPEQESNDASKEAKDAEEHNGRDEKDEGAMTRRLAEMSADSLESGGRGARKAVEDAGFSEELKARLQEKIASANFQSDNANAFAQAGLPHNAGRQTRDLAAAEPWTGSETMVDAANRMLQDAHKPLRINGGGRGPGIRSPGKVDTGRPSKAPNKGVRLANARDKTSFYATTKDDNMNDEERAKYRQELKERFSPTGRVAPATIQGLSSLANERIEDAIARGQFRNLPRGQKVERDHNASNPFLDTTEYFMNKIIQRQEIVPPWIEKQQEIVATSTRFRGQLRASWRRHVSRSIASRGGGLEKQMELAYAYALAESVHNPKKKKVEKINTVDDEGHVSQITLAGDLAPKSPNNAESQENQIQILEQILNEDGTLRAPDQRVTITAEAPSAEPAETATTETSPEPPQPIVPPFRDPDWERTEFAYHSAAIENLNTITRSYNLMAPRLAQKPYFKLDRELNACFADVAPQVADTIKERALAPKARASDIIGHKPGGVLDKFSTNAAVNVYDERKPQYGFKQFWNDLFTKDKT